MGETTAKREWGEPRQSLMGETPKTALPPQDRAASPRPRCIALRQFFSTVPRSAVPCSRQLPRSLLG
ncbi:MAG: hypothetical protein F6K55_23390 [Moorea sp. SIO4A3]|nr:hypothetical protein [Moorena sp. SIO4A3]